MNKGLRALKNASPEAFEKIMGKQAMYGAKNNYAEDGKKMPKELLDYFRRKQAEYGKKLMNAGGVYANDGDKNDPLS